LDGKGFKRLNSGVMHQESEMKLVFFYGLFMDEALLREKGVNPSKPILAFVENFGLRIGERATLVKSNGERAYGLIMSLSEQDLNILYGDKSVADYIPENIIAINSSNESTNVISYNLPLEKLSGQNKQYAESLTIVAKKVGLPTKYVNEIQRWIN